MLYSQDSVTEEKERRERMSEFPGYANVTIVPTDEIDMRGSTYRCALSVEIQPSLRSLACVR